MIESEHVIQGERRVVLLVRVRAEDNSRSERVGLLYVCPDCGAGRSNPHLEASAVYRGAAPGPTGHTITSTSYSRSSRVCMKRLPSMWDEGREEPSSL